MHQQATKLHCHAIKSLNKITKTRHKIHLNNNSDKGGDHGVLLVERLASGGLAAGRDAWLTTRRILSSLCCFSFFLVFGGALASVALVESLSLMHAGDFQRRLLLLLFSYPGPATICDV